MRTPQVSTRCISQSEKPVTLIFHPLPEFAVDGKGIPDVDFDVGESYAGLLPISSNPKDENNLFFWFFPSTNPAASKEILIWLNGGVSFPGPK